MFHQREFGFKSVLHFEGSILLEFEALMHQKFKKVEKIEKSWNPSRRKEMFFIVQNNHVSGIGLHFNRLKTFPESITKLGSLQTLDLKDNKISVLPDSITNLELLQTLNLSLNKLKTLPESIGELKSLEILDLCGNRLTTLPESIGNLQSLQTLYLG